MKANKEVCMSLCNDSDDPTYENWLALFACIVNKKLSVSKVLSIMELNIECDIAPVEGSEGR